MKWAFAVQRKIRLAIFMTALMFGIMLLSLLESYNVTGLSKQFNSIHKDRLVPAVDLYRLAEQVQNRKYLVLSFLHHQNPDITSLKKALIIADYETSNLIEKYEKTYLVKGEKEYLQSFKKTLNAYQEVEKRVLNMSDVEQGKAEILYFNKAEPLLTKASDTIGNLVELQNLVANEIANETNNGKFTSDIIINLQILTTIILGIMIIVLIGTNKVVNVKQDQYNLN